MEQTGRSQRYGYVYDALGRRIEKHRLDRDGKPCNRTTFLWDGLRMIQETGPNHPTSLYIYTDQNSYEPLARIDTDGNQEQHIRYFHTDLNGCPEELTDANGEILWECSFQLWGKRIHEIEHEPIEQNLRYQGQYLDRETGLHYNTFRYYDPDIGRFTQPDPIGLLGGFNLYQYAPNGLTWVDPWGLTDTLLEKGLPLSDATKIYRISTNGHYGFDFNPREIEAINKGKLAPPGVSVIRANSVDEATKIWNGAFPNRPTTSVGEAKVVDLRKIGFDVIHDPSKGKLGVNHARLIQSEGINGFNTNKSKLFGIFKGCKG
ncbi:RHS repeat domain-containing protein [Gilliamella sp. N-G2]|uniref:RHS repeat domain-containing protein n=1 Tax=unclassified Gilliamella TaxID=2685620 RepID=UPI0035277476